MPIRPCVFSDEVAADFEEAVRLSKEAGAEGLELRGRLFGKSITQVDDAEAARIQEICRAAGVQVAVLGSPVGKCDMENAAECREHQDYFRRMVELAHTFGTRLIRGFALWRPNRSCETDADRPDLERYLPRIVAVLEPIVRAAEEGGVRLCLETEGATMVGTCREARRVMDALGGSPALGVAWDVNNGLSCGENPYPDGYELIRDRIYHVHVKPAPAPQVTAAGSLATVGDSSLTYAEIFTALKGDGYDGWASIEHWGSPDAMLKGVRELAGVLRQI
jgi:sugar phosphate isomerase/epimerase